VGEEVSQELAQEPQKAAHERYEPREVRDKRGKRGALDKGATRPRARSEQPLQRRRRRRRAAAEGGWRGGRESVRERQKERKRERERGRAREREEAGVGGRGTAGVTGVVHSPLLDPIPGGGFATVSLNKVCKCHAGLRLQKKRQEQVRSESQGTRWVGEREEQERTRERALVALHSRARCVV
jgi:hypothetical protein